MRYKYTDFDGDRLIIEAPGWPANTASVSVHGNAVYVPADEAPKTAQAILDAAGVKGAVLTGELPKVTVNEYGTYHTTGYSYHPDGVADINKDIRGLLAIKLRMDADAKVKDKDDLRTLAEAAKERAYKKAAAAKKAHDDLRISPIALKALALYNRECIGYGPYESWDATNGGNGYPDLRVKEYIELAEQEEASEKEAAERLAARRLDIYKELGGVFFSNFEPQSPIGYAIDRIISLEDKAT